jgi:hypothetical protein
LYKRYPDVNTNLAVVKAWLAVCFLHLYNVMSLVLSGLAFSLNLFLVGWWVGLVLLEQHKYNPREEERIRSGSGAEAEELTYKGKQTETNHPLKPLCSVAVKSQEGEGGFLVYRFIYDGILQDHFFLENAFSLI